MRWYLLKHQQVYGPYVREQLAAFLKKDDLVAREGSRTWNEAAQDPALTDVLNGKVTPPLEWFVTHRGAPERGPMTRFAVLAQIDRGEITPDDLLRHADWDHPQRLGDTKFYRHRHEPGEDRRPAEMPPPQNIGAAPAESKRRKWLPEIHFDFKFTPPIAAAIALCLLLPSLVYSLFAFGFLGAAEEREARDAIAVYAVSVNGNQVKTVLTYGRNAQDLTVEVTSKSGATLTQSVPVPARTAHSNMGEVTATFDRLAKGDRIQDVRLLCRGELIATRSTGDFAQPLERRSQL